LDNILALVIIRYQAVEQLLEGGRLGGSEGVVVELVNKRCVESHEEQIETKLTSNECKQLVEVPTAKSF
jgi:hypothetical protein